MCVSLQSHIYVVAFTYSFLSSKRCNRIHEFENTKVALNSISMYSTAVKHSFLSSKRRNRICEFRNTRLALSPISIYHTKIKYSLKWSLFTSRGQVDLFYILVLIQIIFIWINIITPILSYQTIFNYTNHLNRLSTIQIVITWTDIIKIISNYSNITGGESELSLIIRDQVYLYMCMAPLRSNSNVIHIIPLRFKTWIQLLPWH